MGHIFPSLLGLFIFFRMNGTSYFLALLFFFFFILLIVQCPSCNLDGQYAFLFPIYNFLSFCSSIYLFLYTPCSTGQIGCAGQAQISQPQLIISWSARLESASRSWLQCNRTWHIQYVCMLLLTANIHIRLQNVAATQFTWFFPLFFIDYLLAIHYIRELRGFGARPKVSYRVPVFVSKYPFFELIWVLGYKSKNKRIITSCLFA